MARGDAKFFREALERGLCAAVLQVDDHPQLGLRAHICQKPAGHADLHECWCEELYDELGLVDVPGRLWASAFKKYWSN